MDGREGLKPIGIKVLGELVRWLSSPLLVEVLGCFLSEVGDVGDLGEAGSWPSVPYLSKPKLLLWLFWVVVPKEDWELFVAFIMSGCLWGFLSVCWRCYLEPLGLLIFTGRGLRPLPLFCRPKFYYVCKRSMF